MKALTSQYGEIVYIVYYDSISFGTTSKKVLLPGDPGITLWRDPVKEKRITSTPIQLKLKKYNFETKDGAKVTLTIFLKVAPIFPDQIIINRLLTEGLDQNPDKQQASNSEQEDLQVQKPSSFVKWALSQRGKKSSENTQVEKQSTNNIVTFNKDSKQASRKSFNKTLINYVEKILIFSEDKQKIEEWFELQLKDELLAKLSSYTFADIYDHNSLQRTAAKNAVEEEANRLLKKFNMEIKIGSCDFDVDFTKIDIESTDAQDIKYKPILAYIMGQDVDKQIIKAIEDRNKAQQDREEKRIEHYKAIRQKRSDYLRYSSDEKNATKIVQDTNLKTDIQRKAEQEIFKKSQKQREEQKELEIQKDNTLLANANDHDIELDKIEKQKALRTALENLDITSLNDNSLNSVEDIKLLKQLEFEKSRVLKQNEIDKLTLENDRIKAEQNQQQEQGKQKFAHQLKMEEVNTKNFFEILGKLYERELALSYNKLKSEEQEKLIKALGEQLSKVLEKGNGLVESLKIISFPATSSDSPLAKLLLQLMEKITSFENIEKPIRNESQADVHKDAQTDEVKKTNDSTTGHHDPYGGYNSGN